MNTTSHTIRFLHSSDWQLGITRAFLSDEALSRYSQARIDAVIELGRQAAAHEAGFIVVAGDVFESNQISRQTLVRTLDALEALPVPVFLLPGNHDALDGASIYATPEFAATSEHVIVLRDAAPVAVPGLDGVEVVGAPWRSRRPNTDLVAAMAEALGRADGVLRVAVGHGQVDTMSPDSTRPDIISLAAAEAAVAAGKFHYLALGDRHSSTDVGVTGRVRYSGTPVVTAFDEQRPNKALLVELEGEAACRVEELDIGDWQFITHQLVVNDEADVTAFAQWLDAIQDKERTAVKVGFVGTVNLATAAGLDALFESKRDLFASLRRRERTMELAVLPDELDEDSVGLSGYAREAWSELLTAAREGDEEAADALRLFYRLAGQGTG